MATQVQLGIDGNFDPTSQKAAEQLQYAISNGSIDMAEQLISKGVPVESPPKQIVSNNRYIESPYIVQATVAGHLNMIECLHRHHRLLSETGHIGFSPKLHNSVISNCLGAAAYHGHFHIIKWIVNSSKDALSLLHFRAIEIEDSKELNGFSPIMLSIAGKGDCRIVKLIINFDSKLSSGDCYGGNLLHACVIYGKIDILLYLMSANLCNPYKKNEEVHV
jgi:ankyrin repeat protein